MHSSRHLQVNARFVPETFVMGGSCKTCKLKTVHGSFVKELYVTAKSASDLNVRVAYSADQPSRAKLTVTADHVDFEMPTEMVVSKFKRDVALPRVVDELKVELTRKHAREASVKVSNGEFVIEAASRYLGWADKNAHKKRLDIGLFSHKSSATLEVAPHGLIGQTFDGDATAVDGAVDDYSADVVVTRAMGEGAIEGGAADYEIDAKNPFSTAFKYTRFHAEHASPRDLSTLTGVRRSVKGGAAAGGVEGATMEGDDVVDSVAPL